MGNVVIILRHHEGLLSRTRLSGAGKGRTFLICGAFTANTGHVNFAGTFKKGFVILSGCHQGWALTLH